MLARLAIVANRTFLLIHGGFHGVDDLEEGDGEDSGFSGVEGLAPLGVAFFVFGEGGVFLEEDESAFFEGGFGNGQVGDGGGVAARVPWVLDFEALELDVDDVAQFGMRLDFQDGNS